uniref:Uncharacterized protein n=1 Tax=Fundulus heteroclitus TaxID=8078 RepID=A0A3Q2PUL4_FUNHE
CEDEQSQKTPVDVLRLTPLCSLCRQSLPGYKSAPHGSWFLLQVVSLYLKSVPPSQRALVLERLRNAMPSNTELGLRLLHQEFLEGNMEQLRFQARMLTMNSCVAAAHGEHKRLLFEAAEGGASDRLRRLVDGCQQAGVNLRFRFDLLNLNIRLI